MRNEDFAKYRGLSDKAQRFTNVMICRWITRQNVFGKL